MIEQPTCAYCNGPATYDLLLPKGGYIFSGCAKCEGPDTNLLTRGWYKQGLLPFGPPDKATSSTQTESRTP